MRYYLPLKQAGNVKAWKVYFQDESRFGLMTILRRAITLPGIKPIGLYQHRFIYRHCYGLIDPVGGDLIFVTAPHVNTFYFEFMLREFFHHEPDVYKIIFLDRAYHRAKHLQVPENIRLVFLPSSNPELNPVEWFWLDIKNKMAFHNFRDEDQPEDFITRTIRNYTPDYIESLTKYLYLQQANQKIIQSMEED